MMATELLIAIIPILGLALGRPKGSQTTPPTTAWAPGYRDWRDL